MIFWNDKIRFNNLSEYPEQLLNLGSQNLGALNKYLAINTFLAEELQKQVTGIFNSTKEEFAHYIIKGDHLFWEMLSRCSPKNAQAYQLPVLTIMAKYFESCDIFDEPKEDD
jgi:hypothetical protein